MGITKEVLTFTNVIIQSIVLSPAYRINAIRHVEAYVVRVVSRRHALAPIGLHRKGAGEMGLALNVDTFALVRPTVCSLMVQRCTTVPFVADTYIVRIDGELLVEITKRIPALFETTRSSTHPPSCSILDATDKGDVRRMDT